MKLYITIKIVRNKDLRVVIFFISIDINRVGFGHVNFLLLKEKVILGWFGHHAMDYKGSERGVGERIEIHAILLRSNFSSQSSV
jgi:hypothetical protein